MILSWIVAEGDGGADVRLGYVDCREERCTTSPGKVPVLTALRYAAFEFPSASARELKVWVHRVSSDGGSEPLPASLELFCGDATQRIDLNLSSGQVILPLPGDECSLRINLPEPEIE